MILATTSSLLRVTTSGSANINVHASWFDYKAGDPVGPGATNTAISSATTTTVTASPASSTYRNIKRVFVRNTHATDANTVTIIHTDGTTAVELYKATLSPGAQLEYTDGTGFQVTTSLSITAPSWATKVIGACTLDPGEQMLHMQRAGNIAATPTNISVSVARCCLFVPEFDITVNRIRWLGVGATTNVYRVALYRWSDLARLTSELAFTTVANTWGSVDAGGVALTANTAYFIACSVNATGTTPGVGCVGGTVAATTGQVATVPSSLPGNMAVGNNYLSTYKFQFTVSTGALPNPAASPAAQAAWTGGMPAFWLDNDTAA